MKKAILLNFLLIFILLNLSVYADTSKNKYANAPSFFLYDLNNKLFSFKRFKIKKFLILSFSATYCKHCPEEIKDLQKLFNQNKKVLDVYLIFVDSKKSDIRDFVKAHKITLPVLHDMYQLTMKKYKVNALPTTFLINSQKQIILKLIGYHPAHIKQILKIISEDKK